MTPKQIHTREFWDHIINVLAEGSAMTYAQLTARLGVVETTAAKYLKAWLTEGMVEAQTSWHTKVYSVAFTCPYCGREIHERPAMVGHLLACSERTLLRVNSTTIRKKGLMARPPACRRP